MFEESAQVYSHFKTLELLGECHLKLGRFKDAAREALQRRSDYGRARAVMAEIERREAENT